MTEGALRRHPLSRPCGRQLPHKWGRLWRGAETNMRPVFRLKSRNVIPSESYFLRVVGSSRAEIYQDGHKSAARMRRFVPQSRASARKIAVPQLIFLHTFSGAAEKVCRRRLRQQQICKSAFLQRETLNHECNNQCSVKRCKKARAASFDAARLHPCRQSLDQTGRSVPDGLKF